MRLDDWTRAAENFVIHGLLLPAYAPNPPGAARVFFSKPPRLSRPLNAPTPQISLDCAWGAGRLGRSWLAWLLLISPAILAPITTVAAEERATIERRMGEVVQYLASDELEGRGIDTAGLAVAADYLADQFQAIGLKTDLYDGGPLQKFNVTTSAKLGPESENYLLAIGPAAEGASPQDAGEPTEIAIQFGKDFRPLAAGGSAHFDKLPLVFVGYGITAPELHWDDYAGVDVEGKAVIVLRHQPRWRDPHSPFGQGPSRHALFRSKISNAFEHGAAAVLFCTTSAEIDRQVQIHQDRWQVAVDRLAEMNEEFKAIENASEEQLAAHVKKIRSQAALIERFASRIEEQRDPVIEFHRAGEGGNREGTPVFHLRRGIVDEILQSALGKNLKTVEKELDKNLQPHSQPLDGWTIRGRVTIERKSVEISNVVGVLEGEGPLAEETIVVGAHYDHLGRGESGAFDSEDKQIHNGADDNGSGVAALLEIARRLVDQEKLTGKKPARRFVFIAFTGEERGLLGSAHYIDDPLYPLDKTIAMLNLDMVGRLEDEKLIVHGTGTAKEFDQLVDRVNVPYQFKLTKRPSGFGPSDHASFYARKIPALHFFTGAHKDYHRPTDDFDKINVEGMARIAMMVGDMALALDSTPQVPEYLATKQPTQFRGGSRPYFGSIPDFSGATKGYAISGASPGSPAARGGLQAGDAIVRFGESRIANLEDFDSALRKYKSGDTVKVVVLRGDKEVTLEVTLDPPR